MLRQAVPSDRGAGGVRRPKSFATIRMAARKP